MDHPVLKEIEMWGYPKSLELHEVIMTDSFRNEIYRGDEYLELDDEVYLIETLSCDAIDILEKHGAKRRVANE